jgi:Xaa-Pro aminopeptidase
MLAPGVELVDGEALMRAVRRVKLPAEIDVIRTGIAIAEGCLATAAGHITAGVTERDVQAAFMDAMASSYAVTVPALAGTFRVVDATPAQPGASDRVLQGGDRFIINAGVLYTGYEADVTHTVDVDRAAERPSSREVLADVIDACRTGAAPEELLSAWTGPAQPGPLVVGLGMGVEPPVIGGPGGLEQLDSEPLEAGMVLGLQGWTGHAMHGAIVHVTDGDPVVLTRLG